LSTNLSSKLAFIAAATDASSTVNNDVNCDLMDSALWGWECMLQLQEVEDRKTPAATPWAEFLIIEVESREFLGLWITSGAIHEGKRRRVTQVIKC
jgi:hypothetical protein